MGLQYCSVPRCKKVECHKAPERSATEPAAGPSKRLSSFAPHVSLFFGLALALLQAIVLD